MDHDRSNNNNNNGNNFARTCNRLSQFMKERRRSLADQNGFAIPQMAPSPSPKPETARVEEDLDKNKDTMSLFPKNVKKNKEKISAIEHPEANIKYLNLNLFPLSSSSTKDEESPRTTTAERELLRRTEEPKSTTASMTIFYAGRVLVFDEFPEDKAEEIISLATQQITKKICPQITSEVQTQIQPQASTSPSNKTMPPQDKQDKQDAVSQEGGGPSDLPIARRTSLFRFIEKRKDRVASAAPYQPQNPSTSTTNSNPRRYNVVMRNLIQRRQEEQKQNQLLDLKL